MGRAGLALAILMALMMLSACAGLGERLGPRGVSIGDLRVSEIQMMETAA
jgi:hypothetical protein